MDVQHEPIPVKNDASIGVTQMVINDLKEREIQGIEKYGTSLQTFNGRNALRDAYQESIDQTQYLKQALLEAEWWSKALDWLMECSAGIDFTDGRVTIQWWSGGKEVQSVEQDTLYNALKAAIGKENKENHD